ncbi:YitT family protein [Cellulomonas sp. Root485]|uniref:membrane protein YczE n=1 Tax=Cellulomonas sp. Root485 TaxID=1736546 RepID=UPI003518FAC2
MLPWMRPDARPVRRGVQLLVGLVLYAASIAMLVDAGLGSMPWDVLTQGIVLRTDLSFGVVTLLTGLVVLACWIPLRQRPGVGTVANVIVISALVDPFLTLLDGLPDALGVRIALAASGIVLNGLATGLYVGARLGPGPRDGLMTGLVRRTGRSVRLVRTTIEVTVVSVGWLLGGTVGFATLAYALAIGPLVHLFLARLTVPVPVATEELVTV